MKTVKEVSKMTGISVRTLHYYDEIGLLKPTETTEAGYRLYGSQALGRLQQILFFRELGFPLKEIRLILDSPSFEPRKALQHHREMLVMERDRLNGLIDLADRTLKGEQAMSFQEFDRTEIEMAQKEYAEEAKNRWGKTEAYRESKQKTASYTQQDWKRLQDESETIFRKFAAVMAKQPDAPEVQALVKEWQDCITNNFYTCTNEILAGLGQMYSGDTRFQKNINRFGNGLADFMSRAIAAYCKK